MNAILEPRMVAESIQDLALSPHGTSPALECRTASSQGALMQTMDAGEAALGSKIHALFVIIPCRNSASRKLLQGYLSVRSLSGYARIPTLGWIREPLVCGICRR